MAKLRSEGNGMGAERENRGEHARRGGMNQDAEDTLLETEIYMILLHNLICGSGDRVRGRSVMELEKKRE